MKEIIISIGIFVTIFMFAILTGSPLSAYNATDNQLTTDFSNFKPSYQDATKVAENN